LNLLVAFERSGRVTYERMQNPPRVLLTWFHEAWDEQERLLGPDPWAYGLSGINRKNLSTLIRYARAQGMIKRHLKVNELFDPAVRSEACKLP